MTDTGAETVRLEILHGMWAARPAELRKAEHVDDYQQSIKTVYPNLLQPGLHGSHDAFGKVLNGLIVR